MSSDNTNSVVIDKADGRLKHKASTIELLFMTIIIVLSLLSGAIFSQSWGTEQNTHLFPCYDNTASDTEMDFFNVLLYSATRDPYNNVHTTKKEEKAYPPLTYMLFYPAARALDCELDSSYELRSSQNGQMMMLYFALSALVPAGIIIYNGKKGSQLIKAMAVAAVLLSGIFIYSIERMNTIFWAWTCVLAFIFGYKSEDKKMRELSYICLAIASALKIYPAVFGILLLRDKRIWDAVRTVIYGIAAFILPFFYLVGGLKNFSTLLENVSLNTRAYKTRVIFFRFGLIPHYLISLKAGTKIDMDFIDTLSLVSYGFILIAIIVAFLQKSNWKAVAMLSLAIVLTPVNSAYYCGLYIVPALIMFLNDNKADAKTLFEKITNWIYLIGFILIFNAFQIVNSKSVMQNCRIANNAAIIMFFVLTIDTIVIAIYNHSKSRAAKLNDTVSIKETNA